MTNPNPPNTLDEANDELKQALTAALLSLADMYDQYCGDNYGHAFMGAGEGAIEILENYGLADEVHGVDWEAYEAFEAKHKVTDKQPSPTKPDIALDVIFNRLADKLGIPRDAYSLEIAREKAQTLIATKVNEASENTFDAHMRKYVPADGKWRKVQFDVRLNPDGTTEAELTKKVAKDE